MGKWEMVRLGDYVEQIRGVSYKPEDASEKLNNTNMPVIRAHNIQADGLNSDNLIYVDKRKIKPNQYIRKGDIVICASSGSKDLVGKAARAKEDMSASFGAFCKVVRPKCTIVSTYLDHYFSSPFYRKRISELSAGANINNLRNEHIDDLQIPLPPLSVQHQIADILDRASVLIEQRKAQIEKLDLLVKSQFIEMFGNLYRNSDKWQQLKLVQVANIASGVTKGRKLNAFEYEAVPYLRVANVKDGYLDLGEVKTINATADEIMRYKLETSDVLLTEGGDPDKLGRGALWNGEITPCIHQNHIFRVRLDTNVVNPRFFVSLLGDRYAKEYFLKAAKQTTGIASINMTQLKNFSVPTPPLVLQQSFERFVECIEDERSLVKQSLVQLELNHKSLMQKCFEGELF